MSDRAKPTKAQIASAIRYFEDFPPGYDAYGDGLAEKDDLAMDINEMLAQALILVDALKK